MTKFTDLERAMLAAICDTQVDAGELLQAALGAARVTKRENTGHGFYTSFEVDRDRPPPTIPDRFVEGPNYEVRVGGQILLMGFILWLEDGYPACLEGFQYGTEAGGDIDLQTEDLGELVALGPNG